MGDRSLDVVQEISQIVEASPNQAAIERSLSKERVDRGSFGVLDNLAFPVPGDNSARIAFGTSASSSPATVSNSNRHTVGFASSASRPPQPTASNTFQNNITTGLPINFSTLGSINARYASTQYSKEPDPLSCAPSVTLSGGQQQHMPLTMDTLFDIETKTINSLMDGITRISNRLRDIGISFRQRQISSRERIADVVGKIFDDVIAEVYKRPLAED